MATPNADMIKKMSPIEKASWALADLQSDGGALPEGKAEEFIQLAIKSADLLPLCTVSSMTNPTQSFPTILLGSRMLHAAQSNKALPQAQITKPTTDEVTITAHLFRGQVDIPDEIMKDNVEQERLQNTILGLIRERAGVDVDEFIISSDTTSTDPDLAYFNGLFAQTPSNPVDAAGAKLSKSIMDALLRALPSQYRKIRTNLRYLVSSNGDLDYRASLAERATAAGDKYFLEDIPAMCNGIQLAPISQFAENLGGTTNRSKAFLCNPKGLRVGWWKQITIEPERSAKAGNVSFVITMRVGFVPENLAAMTKANDILAS